MWKGRTWGPEGWGGEHRSGAGSLAVRGTSSLLPHPFHGCWETDQEAGFAVLHDFELQVEGVLLTAGSGIRGVELGQRPRMGIGLGSRRAGVGKAWRERNRWVTCTKDALEKQSSS